MDLTTTTYMPKLKPADEHYPEVEHHEILYAKVRQNKNSFTMLSITPHPDSTCTRADLMKPQTR